MCPEPVELGLNIQSAYSAPLRPPPACKLTTEKGGRMTYSLPSCEWAACDFAAGVNLAAFDGDGASNGFLEVEFCAEAPVAGQLNLWYGAFPNRKKLPLLLANETMQPGCRTVRFAPENAICHWTSELGPGDCTNNVCAQCRGLCNSHCTALSFASSKLTLIAERCQTKFADPVTIELKHVRLLDGRCGCARDTDCQASPVRTRCATGDKLTTHLCPGGGACGVCVPPGDPCPQEGMECLVTIGQTSCRGVVRCEGGQTSCQLVDAKCGS